MGPFEFPHRAQWCHSSRPKAAGGGRSSARQSRSRGARDVDAGLVSEDPAGVRRGRGRFSLEFPQRPPCARRGRAGRVYEEQRRAASSRRCARRSTRAGARNYRLVFQAASFCGGGHRGRLNAYKAFNVDPAGWLVRDDVQPLARVAGDAAGRARRAGRRRPRVVVRHQDPGRSAILRWCRGIQGHDAHAVGPLQTDEQGRVEIPFSRSKALRWPACRLAWDGGQSEELELEFMGAAGATSTRATSTLTARCAGSPAGTARRDQIDWGRALADRAVALLAAGGRVPFGGCVLNEQRRQAGMSTVCLDLLVPSSGAPSSCDRTDRLLPLLLDGVGGRASVDAGRGGHVLGVSPEQNPLRLNAEFESLPRGVGRTNRRTDYEGELSGRVRDAVARALQRQLSAGRRAAGRRFILEAVRPSRRTSACSLSTRPATTRFARSSLASAASRSGRSRWSCERTSRRSTRQSRPARGVRHSARSSAWSSARASGGAGASGRARRRQAGGCDPRDRAPPLRHVGVRAFDRSGVRPAAGCAKRTRTLQRLPICCFAPRRDPGAAPVTPRGRSAGRLRRRAARLLLRQHRRRLAALARRAIARGLRGARSGPP